jgi:ribosomal protein L11 methyltransferase
MAKKAITITLELTAEQQEQIRQASGKVITHLELAPDEGKTIYREEWPVEFAPFRVGRSLVIAPIGSAAAAAGGEVLIELAPGGSVPGPIFGTGAHPTTRLVLMLLEERTTLGDRVLDLGTGSGIIALAAARLGAREVLALDIDPVAVAAARANVTANGLEGVVEVREGSLEAAGGPPYDLVVANILAPVICSLAPALARVVRPSGWLITSGIVAARVPDVLDSLAAAGFHLQAERASEEWRGLVFRRL